MMLMAGLAGGVMLAQSVFRTTDDGGRTTEAPTPQSVLRRRSSVVRSTTVS
jgi:hypothetical protein